MAPLALDEYQDTVRAALAEDIGAGDVTTGATVDPQQRARAVLVAKTPLRASPASTSPPKPFASATPA